MEQEHPHGRRVGDVDRLFDAIHHAAPSVQSLLHAAPASEWEVVFLLGQLSAAGGFQLVRGTGGFPDCSLRLLTAPRIDLRIEVERDSSQYVRHGHPVDGCDAVVCWTESTTLQLPTLALCTLFPGVTTTLPPTIDFSGKKAELVSTFDHLRSWPVTVGAQPLPVDAASETNTITFVTADGKSLCSLQFCGKGSNEYTRLRFFKKELHRRSREANVADVLKFVANGNGAKYSESGTEHRIDFFAYSAAGCDALVSKLTALL